MSNSKISSSHHYYVLFFQYAKNKTLRKVAEDFFGNNFSTVDDVGNDNIHLEVGINKMYGSETKIGHHYQRRGNELYYLYDIYLGKLNIGSTAVYYLCYPYRALAFYLHHEVFEKTIFKENFYKAKLTTALKYLEERGEIGLTKIEKDNIGVNISKYTAEILDDASADGINLTGINPLNSKIYALINENALSNNLSIRATALKLNFTDNKTSSNIEIALDKLGNYRFWLQSEQQSSTIPMLRYVFEFLQEINALSKSNYINLYSYIDYEN